MGKPFRIDLTQGDTGPDLELYVHTVHPTAQGSAMDLTGVATILWRMRLIASGATYVVEQRATVNGASGATQGRAFVLWGATALASPGQYRAQVTVGLPGGTVTSPPDEPYLVIVHARL